MPLKKTINEKEIIQEYIDGKTLTELGVLYNCNKSTISRILKRNGVEARKGQFSPQYSFNEHYLDKLDTEEKNYFLGMFFADGCNQTDRNLSIISLQEKDKEILERFTIMFESNRPLRFIDNCGHNKQNSYVFSLNSKYLCNKLYQYGAVPRKSLVLKFPEYLDSKFTSAFVRGYFDGDGSITLREYKKAPILARFNLLGTKDFLEELSKILQNELNINPNLIQRGKIWSLNIGKRQDCYLFANWLYGDSTIYLNRKYEKYLKFIGAKNKD